MIPYVKMEAYRKVDGSIDWGSLDQAKVANGEKCNECGDFILFPKGCTSRCQSCKSMQSQDSEYEHSNGLVRCPSCRNMFDPHDCDCYSDLSMEKMTVYCSCGYEFEVGVRWEVHYRSPAMLGTEEETEDV